MRPTLKYLMNISGGAGLGFRPATVDDNKDGNIMTVSTPASGDALPVDLKETLNRLSTPGLGISDTAEERRKFDAISKTFNVASLPVASALSEALGNINDYGSRWIAARMLRDAGLKDETQGELAVATYLREMSRERDSGTRYMLANMSRDIGLKYPDLALSAATVIACALHVETDEYARHVEKNAMMALAMTSEAVAPVAMAALGQILATETGSINRQILSGEIALLAAEYPQQSAAALNILKTAGETETDGATSRRYARDMGLIALNNPDVLSSAIIALSSGMRNATNIDATSGYANALRDLGEKHPMAVILAAETSLQMGGRADQRRMNILNLSGIAALGHAEATAVSKVLIDTLPKETDSYHKRLILKGLTTCLQSRVDEAPVKKALTELLTTEKDRETRDEATRTLRSLGTVIPYGKQPQPAMKA